MGSVFGISNLGIDSPSSSQQRRADMATTGPTDQSRREAPTLPVLLSTMTGET